VERGRGDDLPTIASGVSQLALDPAEYPDDDVRVGSGRRFNADRRRPSLQSVDAQPPGSDSCLSWILPDVRS